MWDFHLLFPEASFIPLHTCSSTYDVQIPISTREGAISPKIYTSASLTIFNLSFLPNISWLSLLSGYSARRRLHWGELASRFGATPAEGHRRPLRSQLERHKTSCRLSGAQRETWEPMTGCDCTKSFLFFFSILRAHLKKKIKKKEHRKENNNRLTDSLVAKSVRKMKKQKRK